MSKLTKYLKKTKLNKIIGSVVHFRNREISDKKLIHGLNSMHEY